MKRILLLSIVLGGLLLTTGRIRAQMPVTAKKDSITRLFRIYEDDDYINFFGCGTDNAYTNGTRLDYFLRSGTPIQFSDGTNVWPHRPQRHGASHAILLPPAHPLQAAHGLEPSISQRCTPERKFHGGETIGGGRRMADPGRRCADLCGDHAKWRGRLSHAADRPDEPVF